MRNAVKLMVEEYGIYKPSHFTLDEFESATGIVVLDTELLVGLERLRRYLVETFETDVQIVITSGTRTEEENQELGDRLGWTDQGGPVARDSRHLPKFGGIAADIFARYKNNGGYTVVPQKRVESFALKIFGYVKADYADGHVHVDCRGSYDGKEIQTRESH